MNRNIKYLRSRNIFVSNNCWRGFFISSKKFLRHLAKNATLCAYQTRPMNFQRQKSIFLDFGKFLSSYEIKKSFKTISETKQVIRQTTKLCNWKCCQKKGETINRLPFSQDAPNIRQVFFAPFRLFSKRGKLQFSNFALKDCRKLKSTFLRVERCSAESVEMHNSEASRGCLRCCSRTFFFKSPAPSHDSSRVLWQRWVGCALFDREGFFH